MSIRKETDWHRKGNVIMEKLKMEFMKLIWIFLKANWFYACGVVFSSIFLKDHKVIDVIGCAVAVTYLISAFKKHLKNIERK